MVLVLIFLTWLGLASGSFANALVWRLREQASSSGTNPRFSAKELSIIKGRSMCPHCGHQLSAGDLVPVLSWLFLSGRCRYCNSSISAQYPIVELSGALVFTLSYVFWPGGVHGGSDWLLLITWLLSAVGLLALLIYDARWTILPNKIIYPTLFIALAGRLLNIVLFSDNKAHHLWLLASSLLVASGVFWLLFMFSKGRWIGYGDVRLGLVIGALLASPTKSFLMIFMASVLGLLFTSPALVRKQKNLASQMPFGPFLISACWLTLLFGDRLINWYTQLFNS